MKRLYLRGVLCVSLALAVLFAYVSASASSFSFSNGITWDAAPAQMLNAEGVHDYDANVHQNPISKRFMRYYILDKADGSEDVYFVYQGDEPVMMYTLPLPDTAAVSVYAHMAGEYTERYGTPIDYSTEELYALFRVIWAESTTLENIERVAAWRLADGTLAALFTLNGDNVMAYIHEARLLAPVEPAAD